MLRIYPVSLQVLRDVRPLAQRIARFDRDHARQLRRASLSVTSNIGEGCGPRDGRQRVRFGDALGSARETLANLEAAEAIGYLGPVAPELRNRLNHIIGVLVKLTRRNQGRRRGLRRPHLS
jgi:four helix bundle protein